MEGLKDCDVVTVTHYDNFEEPCKFLTKDFDLVNYQFIKNRLTQNSGFIVVGVIGKQGVGKSFVLNMLANNFEGDLSNNVPFQTSNINDLITCSQKTNGIDIHVTNDRVILLDCQPILSLNHLSMSIEKEKKIKVFSNEDTDTEGKLKMTSSPDIVTVKLMSYFLSVCHVVLVVDQHILNYRILRLLDLAYRFKPWIPCNSSHLPLDEPKQNVVHSNMHDEFHDYVAQVIFVENMCSNGVITKDQLKQYSKEMHSMMLGYHSRISEQNALHVWLNEMRTKEQLKYNRRLKQKKLQQQREKLLNDSSSILQLEDAKSEEGSDDNCDSLEGSDESIVNAVFDNGDDQDIEHTLHKSIQRPFKLLRIPLFSDENKNILKNARLLQKAVFGCPRKHFCVTQNERFTELCWLEYASEMWQNTKDSQLIVEFFHSFSNIISNEI